jgi:hypothetical protein
MKKQAKCVLSGYFGMISQNKINVGRGSDRACRVTRTGRGNTFATLCGQTGQTGHWRVRNVNLREGVKKVIFI